MNRLHWLVGESSGASDDFLIPVRCECEVRSGDLDAAVAKSSQSISHNATMADR